MRTLGRTLARGIVVGLALAGLGPLPALGQPSSGPSEIELLKREIRQLQERLQRLEQAPPAPLPAAAPAPAPIVAPRPGETEVRF